MTVLLRSLRSLTVGLIFHHGVLTAINLQMKAQTVGIMRMQMKHGKPHHVVPSSGLRTMSCLTNICKHMMSTVAVSLE